MTTLIDNGAAYEFGKWFGDSCVVNGDVPTVVYHGTLANFDEFDYDLTSSRTHDGAGKLGFFFSESREVARFFTDRDDEKIVEAYLRIENPLILSASDFEINYSELDPHEAIALRNLWIDKGYDGIRIEAGGGMVDHDATVWVAFEAEQIKQTKVFNLVAPAAGKPKRRP